MITSSQIYQYSLFVLSEDKLLARRGKYHDVLPPRDFNINAGFATIFAVKASLL
jgi:hypothetical protein